MNSPTSLTSQLTNSTHFNQKKFFDILEDMKREPHCISQFTIKTLQWKHANILWDIRLTFEIFPEEEKIFIKKITDRIRLNSNSFVSSKRWFEFEYGKIENLFDLYKVLLNDEYNDAMLFFTDSFK